MTPERTLVLLQIVELSAKSPMYSHITGVAHDALLNSTLAVLPEVTKPGGAPEHPTSPPPQGPSHQPSPPGPTPSAMRRG